MYQYDEYDQRLVDERVTQFRDQTRRFLAGELSEEEFRPLRLMNGLYIQRHAPMLRVAVPYGLLSSSQLRKLAHIADTYDRGYGHFSTRQNIQFNWPELASVPDILAELATVQMHAIQTSGNCVRNITADAFAGVAPDELEDPRPYCELLRQWSTFHPEFSYLPRKFKIAVSGAREDRAATAYHDIGFRLVTDTTRGTGFRVLVGGGQGRTPKVGVVMREFLEPEDLLSYTEAILRIYNQFGRRDNKYKARIKILVAALGPEEFTRLVEDEWARIRDSELRLDRADIAAMQAHFPRPAYAPVARNGALVEAWAARAPAFARWLKRNTRAHREPGYRAVVVSLKAPGIAPGDITSRQMRVLADLADSHSFGEIRATYDQNLVLADVPETDLHTLWRGLAEHGLATPNIGLLTDMICCPGLDFCSLANARSIPIAAQINARFSDLDYLHDIGELELKMSGCMNACGHHHVGHIGILGVDKNGEEYYQITLGGVAGDGARLGERLGPAITADAVADTIEGLLETYVRLRHEGERFVDTVLRCGVAPFKDRVYSAAA
ncbi:MAG: nitrite/sulfite reductase [Gammaproteobacteria bacterium]